MKKRLFEVPYNFDKKLIDEALFYKDSIELFYVPCFMDDGLDSRHRYFFKDIYPKTRELYEEHINYIRNKGFDIAILFQGDMFDEEKIKYYVDLGIKTFVVRFDRTAKILRKLLPDAIIIASITKTLNLVQIEKLDEKLYDKVVLHYPFNRNLRILKKLPKKFKYIIIPNSACSGKCRTINHWFIGNNLGTLICGKDTKDMVTILPPMLSLFDEYIDTYKLDGRMTPASEIITSLDDYSKAPIYDMNNSEERKEFVKRFGNYEFVYNSLPYEIKFRSIFDEDFPMQIVVDEIASDKLVNENKYLTFDEIEKDRVQRWKADLDFGEGHVENVFLHYNSFKDSSWFYEDKPPHTMTFHNKYLTEEEANGGNLDENIK